MQPIKSFWCEYRVGCGIVHPVSLPSWLLDAPVAPQPIPQNIAKSRWDAPGYRMVGEDLYTLVEPPGYMQDSRITSMIHAWDPGVIPLWRKQLWLSPGRNDALLTFVHHAIARHVKHPPHGMRLLRPQVPGDYNGEVPNVLERVFESEGARTLRQGGPGYYRPWDIRIVRELRRDWEVYDAKDHERRLEGLREERRKGKEEAWEEIASRSADLDRWVQRKLDNGDITLSDWKDYDQKRREIAASRRARS